MSERQPAKFILLNAAYTFVVLSIAIFAAMMAKILLNIFLPIDTLASEGGDYSRNYFLVFPLHGLLSAAAFLAVSYFGSMKVGFKTGFRFRQNISTVSFLAQAFIAVIVYYFLFLYMMEWWANLPTWYLSGFLAALTGIIDASNIYNTVAEGFAETENIYLQYFGLHILLEILFIVGAVFIMRIGRRQGEVKAQKEHESQIAELERERDKIASKKTLI